MLVVRIAEGMAAIGAAVYILLNLLSFVQRWRQARKWLPVLLLTLCPALAEAACTGSSPTWTSTPDNTSIASCVSSASRGDTINVTAGDGTETWTAAITLTKGVSLLGPGRDALEVTRAGNLVTITPDATAIANEETIKLTGFTFNASNSAVVMLQINGAGATGTKPHKYVLIGDNRFKNTTQEAIHGTGQTRGVIYNNIFDRANQSFRPWGNDDYREQQNGFYPPAFGTADNLYFEDNSITCSTSVAGGDPGWIESGQGGRMAVRYNTWNLANCSQQEWLDVHGQQNWSGGAGGQTGTMVTEFYGNTCDTNCNGYRGINHRGGWGLFFNNTTTGSGALAHEVNQYAAGDSGGSGCNDDMPNAGGGYDGQVNNSYFWNITHNGSNALPTSGTEPIADGCGVSNNNGYWNQNTTTCTSSACTAGIGRGTTAPTGTCTVGTAYWVASTATPTVSSSVIQNGHLYKCTSTDTWTDYYTPYTYPHPLRSAGSSGTLAFFLASWPVGIEAISLLGVLWHIRKQILAVSLAMLGFVSVSSWMSWQITKELTKGSAVKVLTHFNERMKR